MLLVPNNLYPLRSNVPIINCKYFEKQDEIVEVFYIGVLSVYVINRMCLDSLVGKASDRTSEDAGSNPAPVLNILITH